MLQNDNWSADSLSESTFAPRKSMPFPVLRQSISQPVNDMWSILNDKFKTITLNMGFSEVPINVMNLIRAENENWFRYYALDKNGYRQLFEPGFSLQVLL